MGFFRTLGRIADDLTGGAISGTYEGMKELQELKNEYRENLGNGSMHMYELKEIYQNGGGIEQMAAKAILKEEGVIDDDGNLH